MSATIDNGGFLIMAKKTHGMYNTRVYHIWENMKQRTLNPNYPKFCDYGGRGIDICDDWHDFINFYNDMGEPLEHESIDRIDNNKGIMFGIVDGLQLKSKTETKERLKLIN